MPRVSITREVHFSAAHRVFNPTWSDERNEEVFGDCANPNWHGHDYVLYVSVEGELDRDTGFVMNFRELKSVVVSRVVDDMDHRNVNLDVPWMDGLITSAENIVVAIWGRLVDHLPEGVTLAKLTLWETPRHYVEYSGE
jgi:6-pyruvoyltetrahydropterin/6-carboxytetrahydropterin synthase